MFFPDSKEVKPRWRWFNHSTAFTWTVGIPYKEKRYFWKISPTYDYRCVCGKVNDKSKTNCDTVYRQVIIFGMSKKWSESSTEIIETRKLMHLLNAFINLMWMRTLMRKFKRKSDDIVNESADLRANTELNNLDEWSFLIKWCQKSVRQLNVTFHYGILGENKVYFFHCYFRISCSIC